MKRVIIKGEPESTIIYFDFEKDFPQLGCKWICDAGGYTDCDYFVDATDCEYIEKMIDELYQEECDDSDYEYVSSLVEAWGL